MNYRCWILMSLAVVGLLSQDSFGRGGGGGGGGNRGGGGGGGASRGGGGGGGGFSGGVHPSGGASAGNMNARSGGNPGAAMNAPRPSGGSNGFSQSAAGQRPAGNTANRAVSPQAGSANRASAATANRSAAPSQNQLNGFLGLPSDEGMSHASASANASSSRGNNLDVNYGTKEGPNGGQAAGITVTGQNGNTVGRAAAVGSQGGTAVAGGAQGANGATAARGAAVGPNGGAVAAGGVQGANGASAARGAAVGPNGGAAVVGGAQGANGAKAARGAAVDSNGQAVAARGAVDANGYGGGSAITSGPAGSAAGFARVTPSGRYTTATAVRGNYNNWGIYGQGWNAQYPGAWIATGLAAGAVWNASTWGTASAYVGYPQQEPVYYDYGNSVVYEDGSVYVNGGDAGTSEEYYDQAATLANTGSEAKATPDEEWLPLGVFALTKPDAQKSDVNIQLALNKEGIIRGNYTDIVTNVNQVVQGSVDKETQRVAFSVGDNKTNIIETGLYNLTKDEAPALLHFGNERTEQWLLVRLTNPDTATN